MDYSDDISFQRPDCLLSRKQTCTCVQVNVLSEIQNEIRLNRINSFSPFVNVRNLRGHSSSTEHTNMVVPETKANQKHRSEHKINEYAYSSSFFFFPLFIQIYPSRFSVSLICLVKI